MTTSIKLNNLEMQSFIRSGYVVIDPGLPAEFHRSVFESIDGVFETEGNPGNNLMARIPAINEVWDDPSVAGALESILGPNYYMHPHRHCHFRPPHSEGQVLHKDGFSRRRHRTRWVLAMYYPQETTLDMGPTAVVPGSHYYNTEDGGTAGEEIPLSVPAGSVAIVNYDIWHRGMENRSDRKRYMVKFLFLRMEEPRSISWEDNSQISATNGEHEAMLSAMWAWHTNIKVDTSINGSGDQSIEDLLQSVVDNPEPNCLDAAYLLAQRGIEAVPSLVNGLMVDRGDSSPSGEVSYGRLASADRPEQIRRNISYALTAVGKPAVPALIDALTHDEWWVRDTAVETLGDIGLEAEDAVPYLIKALGDESRQVRRHASEALGITSQTGSKAVPALIDLLRDNDEVIRRNSVLALARVGSNAHEAISALKDTLSDQDRYVRGKSLEALRRIGTLEANNVLIEDLLTSRWCEITTKDNLF